MKENVTCYVDKRASTNRYYAALRDSNGYDIVTREGFSTRFEALNIAEAMLAGYIAALLLEIKAMSKEGSGEFDGMD